MARWFVTGRIIPERRSFSHDKREFRVQDPDAGVRAKALVAVNDNQLAAILEMDAGACTPYFVRKTIIEVEQSILNAEAFVPGIARVVDIIGLVRFSNCSLDIFNKDDVTAVIKERQSAIEADTILRLCDDDDGLALRSCLNDLRMAITEMNDAPLYCYRAVEAIKNRVALRYGEQKLERKWQIFKEVLKLDETNIRRIEILSKPIRHGEPIQFTGVDWKTIVLIAWDVAEAYIKHLEQIASGAKKWPT